MITSWTSLDGGQVQALCQAVKQFSKQMFQCFPRFIANDGTEVYEW